MTFLSSRAYNLFKKILEKNCQKDKCSQPISCLMIRNFFLVSQCMCIGKDKREQTSNLFFRTLQHSLLFSHSSKGISVFLAMLRVRKRGILQEHISVTKKFKFSPLTHFWLYTKKFCFATWGMVCLSVSHFDLISALE